MRIAFADPAPKTTRTRAQTPEAVRRAILLDKRDCDRTRRKRTFEHICSRDRIDAIALSDAYGTSAGDGEWICRNDVHPVRGLLQGYVAQPSGRIVGQANNLVRDCNSTPWVQRDQ